MKRVVVFLSLAALAVALAGGGSAAGAPVKRAPLDAAARTSLATPAGLASYLRSLGLSPKGFVVQRGSHNYAGARCPGARWSCTSAGRVIQLFGVVNQFTCSPAGPGTAPPNTCVIVQVSATGSNSATCVENVSDTGVAQSCTVFQTSVSGANSASVSQSLTDAVGSTQVDSQSSGINQQNSAGSNSASVRQDLSETSTVTAAAGASTSQAQNGHQTASVTQHSDTGDNGAHVTQSLALKASASGGATIDQSQNADASAGFNSAAAIYQNADENPSLPTSTGSNDGSISQTSDLNGDVSAADTATQLQGAAGNGLLAHLEQLSRGVSTASESQDEHQNLTDSGIGHLTQSQYGPMWANSPQQSNPADTYTIDQSSDQSADPSALQDDRVYGNCDTSGNCTVSELLTDDLRNVTNSCSSASCHIGLSLIEGALSGVGAFTCGGLPLGVVAVDIGPCPTPPVAPVPLLAPTTTLVASSSSLARVGSPVTFTATVAGALPAGPLTGRVTFSDGRERLGSSIVRGGTASFTTSALSAGVHAITATYSGNGTYAGSRGRAVQIVF